MRYLLFGLILFLSSQVLDAQIRLGIRAGAHTASLKGEDLFIKNRSDVDTLRLKASEAKLGFRVGVISRITLGKLFYIQPEVLFRTLTMDYESESLLTEKIKFRSESFYNIDVPILAGVKLGPIRAQAGPIASMLVDSKSDFTDLDSYKRNFNAAEWAFQAGVGLDLGTLGIDVIHQRQLNSSQDEINIGNQSFQLSGENAYWIFALALFFNK